MATNKKQQKINRDIENFNLGKKEVEKAQSKIDNDPTMDAMQKTDANAKVAFQFLRKAVFCKKLSSLEDIIVNDPHYEYKGVIAMYIYFHKWNKVSAGVYPNLFRIMNEFEEAVTKFKENDPYFEVFQVYELKRNKKNAKLFNIEARNYINNKLESEGISIKQLSDYTGVQYANLYNFLVKEDEGKVKLEKVHKVLWMLNGLTKGWTPEEGIKKHREKIKNLWKHWKVDVD